MSNETDKYLMKAFEQTTNVNLQGVVDYSKDTRKVVRELEAQVKGFERSLRTREGEITQLKAQVAALLAISVREGSI